MKTELIIGNTYGKWLILNFDCVDAKRRRRYNCRCECGTERSVIASAIASGHSTSCVRCKSDNLTGKKFGSWTVIGRSDEIKGSGYKTLWNCKCDCGAEHLVERGNLIKGTSLGCWICRRNVIAASKFPKIWYRKLMEQAKLRSYKFELSEDELWNIWEDQNHICPLTGLSLEITDKLETTTASVDRIQNNLGYIKNNVWFIHKHVNMMKHRYELSYFKEMCCLVAKNVT